MPSQRLMDLPDSSTTHNLAWTGTTTADAGSIHDAQASAGFSALLMLDQGLVSRTPQRPIGLESKVLTREAASFPG